MEGSPCGAVLPVLSSMRGDAEPGDRIRPIAIVGQSVVARGTANDDERA
jgi:hypothetical protein